MVEFFEERSAKIKKEENTFFNPAQILNRDISAAVIKSIFKDRENIRIFTAMSATGLRGIRYLKEIPNAQMFFNDICPNAISTIKENLKYNGFDKINEITNFEDIRDSKSKINITKSDCNVLMNQIHRVFDVVDIDPFGSCAEFVNAAFQATKHNGIICFTCTDKAALCANERKCFVKYNTLIKRVYAKNETPIRVLLSYISREFAKYDASIEPIISLSVDFYVRVIVRVKRGRGRLAFYDNSHVFICECQNYLEQKFNKIVNSTCQICNSPMKLYGPFWNRELHNKEIIEDILKNISEVGNERIVGLLRLMHQEINTLFYYEMSLFSKNLKLNCCKIKYILYALINEGYLVSFSHCDNNIFKTNASLTVVNEIIQQKVYLNSKSLEEEQKFSKMYIFEEVEEIKRLFEMDFHRGLMKSGMKPGSLPKK